MSIEKLFPSSIKNYLSLIKKRKQYPNSNIYTYRIHNTVELGVGSALSENVDLRKCVKIGNYSYVNKGTIIGSGEIGKFCSIGYNCQIGMFEHPTKHMPTSPFTYNKNWGLAENNTWDEIYSPPKIGNDVWIGSNVLVLQGVTIGDGAVIAGGAVVTKDVPPYSIVGGIPAKVIKMRFDSSQIEFLKELKWWDLSIDDLKKYKHLFEAKEEWGNLINTHSEQTTK